VRNKYPTFAAQLRRKMADRRMGVGVLSKALGCNPGSLVQWRNGYRLPTDRMLGGLADILDAPVLVEMALDIRSGDCVECGKPFRQHPKAGSQQRFCSHACKSTHNNRLSKERTRSSRADRITQAKLRERYALAARDKAMAEAAQRDRAIAAFCRSCEWDGVCKMADCELREFSPLPLSKEAAA